MENASQKNETQTDRQLPAIERLWIEGLTTHDIAAKLRLTPRIVGRALREIRKRYRPDFVGIEAEQFQELLIHEFHRQCQGFNARWSVWEMLSKGFSKVARIRRLTRYVVNRELRFRADSPGCRLLVDQLMDFPLADHDDGPDALEMCMRLPVDVKRLR